MAVFGGIFSRKDKKSGQDHSAASSVPASPVVGPPSPSTLKKSSPLPKSYNNTSPEAPPRERSHRPPSRASLDANRALADSREHRRDLNDDDATTTAEGEYVLPLIDSPSLMNGMDRSDYFSTPTPSSSKPLAKKPPVSNNNKSPALLLPSVHLSPIRLPMSVEEDEDERPLGLRVGKPSRSTPPSQVVASSAGPGNFQQPRGHTRNGSLELLTAPTISTNVASSVRSLPLNSPTSPVTSGKQRPSIPTHLLSVPRPSSPTESSVSHFPISPSSIGGSDSTRPTSPTSVRSKATIPKFGAPLLKFTSRDPPPQLNPESESKNLSKAERAKSKEREKEKASGNGMFSFMRDRKKSTPIPVSPSPAAGDPPSPAGNNSRGSLELLGRISFSSSKSEGQAKAKDKDDAPPPPVPPLPPITSLDTMPPLRPIPVDRKPSIEKGFVPPVRRKYVPPGQQQGSGAKDAEEKDVRGKQGSFELVSFRHVSPAGPTAGVGAVRSTSPGPFQGLELTAGRDRSGSFASDTSATKTTVSAFRQAQQRKGTGLSSALSEGRRSTADLFEEAETRKSMDAGKALDSLPLPGPPAPAPVDLPEPVRPYAAIGGASPRGSLDGGSRPSTPPVRPPRTNPPPGVRGASPVNHRDKPKARGKTTPRKGVTQSAYGQLYTSTTSSEDDSEGEDSSDDDVPLGARGRGVAPKKAKDGVSRKTTITQKNAPSTTSLVEKDDDDEDRPSKRDTIIAPKQTQTSSHIRGPASSAFGRSPAQALGGRNPASASSTPGGRSPASTTPAPAATVPLGTPIARPHKAGVVVPPPRSSSLFVDTKRPASTALLESTTSPTITVTTHNRAHSASLLGGGLAGYSTSKASKSLGSVNLSSPSPTATSGKRPMPPPMPKSRPRPADSSTSDDSESEKSSSDDDAPLGLLKRPGSSLSLRSHQSEGWGTRSELNHGVSNHGGRRPVPKNGAGKSSNSSSSTPSVPRPPPRDARRPPPPGPSSSLPSGVPHSPASKSSPPKPNVPARSMSNAPTQPNMPSLFTQPPMRPFAGGGGMTNSFYASSPGGSSNGDSYSSSTRLPLTPRDGSELGTTSGSSLLGGKKEGAAPTASAMSTGKKPYHGRKSSVTFEDSPGSNGGRRSSEEEKRKERRREEAKAAIQMGNAINGPAPQLSDDETDLYTTQMRLSGMPNLGAAGPGVPGMNMGWDPQMLMMMQAQQAQMMAAAMNMNMGTEPNYMNAHQQALLFAKQAYQWSVAQQAMEAAGDEWERASNVNGPAGGSVSGASMLGGAGGFGGMPPYMGMAAPGMMGMPMGMGMPMMNMGMGMGMPGMLFPPAPSSAYGGSTAGSVYGGGSRIRQNFPSSASAMGDPAPSETARSRKPRTRNNTTPSNAPLPTQHSSRLPPPPSSWKP